MKNIILLSLLVSICLIAVSCANEEHTDDFGLSTDADFNEDDYKSIIPSNNALGFSLITEVEANENGNSFVSPTSLLMALSMVYNGADGVTKEEMANVLQNEGMDIDEWNKANASLMSMLHRDSDHFQLHVANSIWLNDFFHFQDEFAQNNKDYFNAEIHEIDITDNESAERINDWVTDMTNDKIDNIVDSPLNPDLVAILINAIYFKGDWTYAFDENKTEERTFHLDDGTTKDVPLMTQSEDLAYMENESFQAVTLPYGDEEMSMNVFLPRENSSVDEFKAMLTEENWTAWSSQFDTKEGTIMLPKFQLEYETILNETLEKLGMESAFDEDANFPKMIEEDDPLWISQVKQKTFIDVNEEGTEAAAATSVEMEITSAPIDEPFHMEVNRPFFITITDDETDAILFMGSISNPMQTP
ncbi:serpin B [Virgibacillus natechei]|uniref:Serpin B n=1 Tax=Virgibacillus natechei TaxID=1216297 RepID=A0ABS4IBL1_9BACI|nr:serpin family protein [Virgibacillus natechei]MBP1968322.1 serpin B [Virgibacillus natechei]UZD13457.1 serpin family protein [Virgibacillus natechei]